MLESPEILPKFRLYGFSPLAEQPFVLAKHEYGRLGLLTSRGLYHKWNLECSLLTNKLNTTTQHHATLILALGKFLAKS